MCNASMGLQIKRFVLQALDTGILPPKQWPPAVWLEEMRMHAGLWWGGARVDTFHRSRRASATARLFPNSSTRNYRRATTATAHEFSRWSLAKHDNEEGYTHDPNALPRPSLFLIWTIILSTALSAEPLWSQDPPHDPPPPLVPLSNTRMSPNPLKRQGRV